MDRFRFSVPGLTLPSRCPCCIGGANEFEKTQSLVAPTLELKYQDIIVLIIEVNVVRFRNSLFNKVTKTL